MVVGISGYAELPQMSTFRGSSAVERSPVDISQTEIYNMYMSDNRKYADRREALIKAVAKRRKKVKELAVEYKGGKCQLCNYSKCIDALEFHHIDSSKKEFGIGDKGYTRSWDKVRNELDKCIILCANCHREIASGITQLSTEK